MIQSDLQRGFQKAAQVAGVIPAAFKVHSDHALSMAQGLKTVGQLDLAAVAGRLVLQNLKNLGHQHIAAEDGVVGEFLLRGGLFVQVRYTEDTIFQR